LRDLEEGEEITCDYKYSLKKDPPDWYIGCLRRHLEANGVDFGDAMDKLRGEKREPSRCR